MKRIISFSLFGSGDRYNAGAVLNARLAPEIYPGWVCRFYCDPEVTVREQLKALGCEIVDMPKSPGGLAMSWRFLPVADPSIERVICRDGDSRLNVREAVAVDAWIASGLPLHAMHDHPEHAKFPVFGGMWGSVGGFLPLMPHWMDSWGAWKERMDDMNLLTKYVQPLAAGNIVRHSSVPLVWPYQPFPAHPPYDTFVGDAVLTASL